MANLNLMAPQMADYIAANPWVAYVVALQVVMKVIFCSWALYMAGKRKQKVWFGVLFAGMFVLNDFGLLPILYLIFTRRAEKFVPVVKVSVKKKR